MRKWTLVVVACSVAALLAIGISRSYSDDAKAGWVAPADEAKKANPVAADEASIAVGKTAFENNCTLCHGMTGKGDGRMGAVFKVPDLSDPSVAKQSDGALYWKITTGNQPMAAYKDLLTDKERWSIVNYLRKLAKPAASQPAEKK